MRTDLDIGYGISGRIVRRGLTKIVEISITDGKDTWTFDTAESFTMRELKQRFPYFVETNKQKRVKSNTIAVLPGQTNIMETLENE